jgi:hypothetical protein
MSLITDDVTVTAEFRKSYPLDFSLYDDNDQPVLPITEDATLQKLNIDISNISQHNILFAASTDRVAAANHHFELRFRPGTVSAPDKITIAQSGWSLANQTAPDGTTSLYFLNSAPQPFKPGDKLTFTLVNIGAAAGGGARGTRVELKSSQLTYQGDSTSIEGSRLQHLSIVNESGKKYIPLHVGFSSSNTVLNDGKSVNQLFVRIANLLKVGARPEEGRIALNPDKTSGSKFIVSFDVDDQGNTEWALCRHGEIGNDTDVKIISGHWNSRRTDNGQGVAPEWTLTPDTPFLEANESIEFMLAGLRSSSPSGQANLYVRYENIPGYWDGQFIVPVEKSPLVVQERSVGIGTLNSQSSLAVAGSVAIGADYAENNPAPANGLIVEGSVGIGTASPRSALDTGTGLMTGAALDYVNAQFHLSGGGTVTWRYNPDVSGGLLQWSQRFIAIAMGGGSTFSNGHINIKSSSDLLTNNVCVPAQRVTKQGVYLGDWEALYAIHEVGKDENQVTFAIHNYYPPNFTVPSNWILVAVVNGDDKTVKLGTGATVSPNSSASYGSSIPVGTIMMWHGSTAIIPGGWALCDGNNGRPNLSGLDQLLAFSQNNIHFVMKV